VTELALLVLIIAGGTGGELCLARAMKNGGEVADFRPTALLHMLRQVLADGWLWLGIGLLLINLVALLGMLSVENVSFVVPMTALSYAVGALGGRLFLGERVDAQRWIGVLLVCGGVALVFVGGK
jgi:drug/metabolite transporter (DMT)-like permease